MGAPLAGDRVERRLAAVLAADVAGYSRLMGGDEEGTLARLKAVRKLLLTPPSLPIAAVSSRPPATECWWSSPAQSMPRAARWKSSAPWPNRTPTCPQDVRIEFRIGIHVGDIIIDDNDIFGDGVNIAARLEGIAEPGGVCMSDDAYRQVRGKVEIGWDDLGPQTLKNIAEPMRAWRVQLDGSTPATAQSGSPASEAQSLPLLGQALDRRLTVSEYERRSGAGVFRRRLGGGHHHRAVALSRVRSYRSQLDVLLQGQAARRGAGRPGPQGALCARRQRAQGRQPRSGDGTAH